MSDDARSRFEALERRQALLRQELAALDETLAEMKYSFPAEPPPIAATLVPPPLPVSTPAEDPQIAPTTPVPPPLPPPPRIHEPSLEMRVGTVWLARIGIVILLTGLVFLANFAWQSLMEHFGSYAKLGILYLIGGGLCATGVWIERRRESMHNYAGILIAGGMAAIYYTTYAAHYVPSLKIIASPMLAGILLVLLAGVIGWVADRRNSQATAGLAIVLAFYASAVNPLTSFTLFSNAILGVAAVVLMARKRWMVVPFLALAATYWSYLYWRLVENWKFWEVHSAGDADLGIRLTFLSVYWLIFTTGGFLSGAQKISVATRVVFSTLNDAAFFSLAAIAISLAHHDSLWIISLVFGLIQLALALTSRGIYGPGTSLASAWLGKAIFFLTLAALIRLTGDGLAIILAIECSLLVFAARQIPSRVLAASGPLVGVLAMLTGMSFLWESGTYLAGGLVALLLLANARLCKQHSAYSFRPLLLAVSGMALGCAVLSDALPQAWEAMGWGVLGLVFVAGLPLHKSRELTSAGLLAAAGSMAIQLVLLESTGFWPSLTVLILLSATAVTGRALGRDDKTLRLLCGILSVATTLLFWAWTNANISVSQQFCLVSLAATAALALSRGNSLRQAISLILAVAALLILLGHGAGSEPRFAPLDLLGAILLLAQERMARFVKAPVGIARFAGIAGLLSLLGWVTSTVRAFHDPLPLTAAWALLALVVFFAGFLARARILRMGGLGILALALGRILLLDVWRLDLPFRILSFLILGSVLLVLGYLYNRYADRIRSWL